MTPTLPPTRRFAMRTQFRPTVIVGSWVAALLNWCSVALVWPGPDTSSGSLNRARK
ncbi:hypothetical protein FA95DRAFT_1552286 [Auriscalpium vulgare]|uniref:Uncharacterized protein n=1 Tax=Auriscalpium vulgare TaxID=40419 RepID=A0ACB8SC21_9AGAM|nr:hypothetical protein FA95DRAFT_1552286 [Auriscalpium vulgare]